MEERIRALIGIIGLDELVRTTDIGSTRWKTVRYDKRTRISTKEMEALIELRPQYALWLATGQIAPAAGQTSPDYDEANAKLAAPHAG